MEINEIWNGQTVEQSRSFVKPEIFEKNWPRVKGKIQTNRHERRPPLQTVTGIKRYVTNMNNFMPIN